jgi:hypothetical protein
VRRAGGAALPRVEGELKMAEAPEMPFVTFACGAFVADAS